MRRKVWVWRRGEEQVWIAGRYWGREREGERGGERDTRQTTNRINKTDLPGTVVPNQFGVIPRETGCTLQGLQPGGRSLVTMELRNGPF